MDIAATMVGLKAAQTQQLAQYAIIKKQHEMQLDLISQLVEVARSAPAPGTGRQVDRTA